MCRNKRNTLYLCLSSETKSLRFIFMYFFAWGYLKSKVYSNNPQAIIAECQNINQTMRNNVFRSFEGRLHRCIDVNGAHVE